MARAITFDTLAYANKLKSAGVPDKQAEIQAEAIAEIIDEQLATKRDLKEVEERLMTKIEEMSYKLTIRLGGIVAAGVAVLVAIMKL